MDVDGIGDEKFEMLGEDVDEDGDFVGEENTVGVVETSPGGSSNHVGRVNDGFVRQSPRR